MRWAEDMMTTGRAVVAGMADVDDEVTAGVLRPIADIALVVVLDGDVAAIISAVVVEASLVVEKNEVVCRSVTACVVPLAVVVAAAVLVATAVMVDEVTATVVGVVVVVALVA